MEFLLSACLGIGLAAACGFRVFVPLLGVSAAGLAGHVELAEGVVWMATWPALVCFATATVLEIAAYYVPWVDNLLDSIATPAAVLAGTIAMGSVISDLSPLMRWTLALIAGGGTAGLIQSATVALRGGSTVATAGTGNWLVATIELIGAIGGTLLSLAMPFLAAGLALVLVVMVVVYLGRRVFQRPAMVRPVESDEQ